MRAHATVSLRSRVGGIIPNKHKSTTGDQVAQVGQKSETWKQKRANKRWVLPGMQRAEVLKQKDQSVCSLLRKARRV